MQRQVTYTEEDLAQAFNCNKRTVENLRKLGYLKGTRIGTSYIYHDDEITEFFEKNKGIDIKTREKASRN